MIQELLSLIVHPSQGLEHCVRSVLAHAGIIDGGRCIFSPKVEGSEGGVEVRNLHAGVKGKAGLLRVQVRNSSGKVENPSTTARNKKTWSDQESDVQVRNSSGKVENLDIAARNSKARSDQA
jgi:hypothetical protein